VFPPPAAMDELTSEEKSGLAAKENFIHADLSYPFHYGKGKLSVYDRVVFLDQNFEVGPGPKFHVYLVPSAKIRNSGQVKKRCLSTWAGYGRSRAARNTKYWRGSISRNTRESLSDACSSAF
jgi:hypothetical protein